MRGIEGEGIRRQKRKEKTGLKKDHAQWTRWHLFSIFIQDWKKYKMTAERGKKEGDTHPLGHSQHNANSYVSLEPSGTNASYIEKKYNKQKTSQQHMATWQVSQRRQTIIIKTGVVHEKKRERHKEERWEGEHSCPLSIENR